MKASVVQSLMARTRREISSLEEWAFQFKSTAEKCYRLGQDESGHFQVKLHRKYKAEIKKLVEIQKELKAELQRAYYQERNSKHRACFFIKGGVF